MDDDILNGLDGLDDVLADAKKSATTNKNQNGRNDLYTNKDIKPRVIAQEDLLKADKSYIIATPDNRVALPEEAQATLVKIATSLTEKGYILRFSLNETDSLGQKLLAIPNIKVVSYLPWPKYNTKAPSIITKRPTELAYRIACGFIRNFVEKPDAIRCIEAHMVQTLLGLECNQPPKFVIAYSECGQETLTKDTDYTHLKSLPSYMRMCKKFQIPFINVKNKEAIQNISNLIKE